MHPLRRLQMYWSVKRVDGEAQIAFAEEIIQINQMSPPNAREALRFLLGEIQRLEQNLENMGNLLTNESVRRGVKQAEDGLVGEINLDE